MSKLTYVAIPYTFSPDLSFAIANEVSSTLMELGEVVFSPISHSHHVADYLPKKLRTSAEFWLKQDLPILKKCDELLMVVIGDDGERLIKESVGCQAEIACAIENNIPIKYHIYEI